MPESDSNRIKEVFADAAELSGDARQRYLDYACAGDPELLNEVQRLLSGLDHTGDLLDASWIGEFVHPAAPPGDALSPGDKVGRFRIIRMIGKGGMGEVYEADDPEYHRHVALKTLRQDLLEKRDFVARFRREIQLAWRVTHPNVCRIYDVGQCQIHPARPVFMTMELLEGETLAERLKRGVLQPEEAAPIFGQIAAGLIALHDARVVHRDLKPGNVMLTSASGEMRCVITDFGLAHASAAESESDRVTLIGQVIGTPAYMAPEQLVGKKVGPEADIYALGVVMYEVLCGRRPFDADQFVECASLKLHRSPRPPSRIRALNREWDRLILRCLQPEVAKRPSSAREVAARLELLRQSRQAPGLWGRAARVLRPVGMGKRILYATMAAGIGVAVPVLRIPALRTPVLRQACRQFPGLPTVCELPASRDMAVLPFAISGATSEDRALAAGLAQYVRESMQRLHPTPGSVCVHLRNDRLADGVQLVVEGSVEAAAGKVVTSFVIRERASSTPGAEPLTLRRITVSTPRPAATRLHWEPIQQLTSALETPIGPAEWHAWLQLTPSRPESLVAHFKGLGYLQEGRYEEAAREFSSVLEPGNDFAFAPSQVGLGDAYRLMLNKTRDDAFAIRARQAYRRAATLDRDFGFAGAEKRWGELEAGAGQTQAAIEHLSNSLRLWPYDPAVQYSLAAAYETATQDRRSEGVLRDAVERSPRCWLTHNTLASFYSRHARFQDAERELLEVVRLAPQNANAYHNLAFDYIKAGRLDDAIGMASKSIRLRPLPLAYSTLGRAYLYRGCSSDALPNLRKAVEVDSAYYVLWGNLAEGLYAIGRDSPEARLAFTKTVELSRRALQTSPSTAYARAQLALNLARLGQRDAAVDEIGRALRLAPESHDIMLLAAETREVLSSRPLALAELGRAFGLGLSVHEAEMSFGLAALRRDPAYAAMLRRFQLKPSPDPGGVTPRARGQACPSPAPAQ